MASLLECYIRLVEIHASSFVAVLTRTTAGQCIGLHEDFGLIAVMYTNLIAAGELLAGGVKCRHRA